MSIEFDNDSVSEALDKLGKAANCDLYYRPSDLPANRTVTVFYEKKKVSTIIKEIWGDDQLILRASSDDISIKPKPKQLRREQKGSLQGRVADDNNEPIYFATIAIKGTSLGTVTDESGTFEIKGIPVGSHVLAISSMGYESREQEIIIEPNATLTLNIKVPIAVKALDEVVVVGHTEEMRTAVERVQVAV
mgnify:CR=1 FL=1